jgi:hypothetical protein
LGSPTAEPLEYILERYFTFYFSKDKSELNRIGNELWDQENIDFFHPQYTSGFAKLDINPNDCFCPISIFTDDVPRVMFVMRKSED